MTTQSAPLRPAESPAGPTTTVRAGRVDAVTRVATTIAAILAIVGVGVLLGGVVGISGRFALGGVRSMLFVGVGLVGVGAGALLLLVLAGLSAASR